jgi:hypothetical protein
MFSFIVPPFATDELEAEPANSAAATMTAPSARAAPDSQSLLFI